ncbi:MAG: carboxypeptidase-like regulatory domain-containing protein [Pirellulales bacterium]
MRLHPHSFQLLSFLTLGCLVVSSFGCGQSSGPNVQYVHGVITLDGAPIEGATVSFSPEDSNGIGASGMTQSDGSFTLNAQAAKPGAGTVAGEYAVTVSKVEMPEFPNIDTDDPRYGTAEQERLEQEANNAKPKVIVPEKYNTPESSPLHAKVVSGKNEFQFDLISKE